MNTVFDTPTNIRKYSSIEGPAHMSRLQRYGRLRGYSVLNLGYHSLETLKANTLSTEQGANDCMNLQSAYFELSAVTSS